ncbi:cytosolic phospholipase A2 gamma-like [Chanodichthys erythropterus]|uniref:cytosolic phospholipase A2 gamma-like n=1 Tax=Chanodichthys erythropterus TaxID=933992 RepID=UPI00351E526C
MGACGCRQTGAQETFSIVEVRIEHSLNKGEKEFVVKRRKAVQESLMKLNIQCSQNEVPNIALLGSGGGQRAMVGLLGSLVQLQKTGLLDCVLYLSGVSGSTWCMASLYQEPNWSTDIETVKNNIIERLKGPGVSWIDTISILLKYYNEKDHFSFTDIWAAMFVTTILKEVNKQTLTNQKLQHEKDPFPIYTVIDKKCKQSKDGDPWFEFTPYEAGYSLTGAFVETSSFGSKFENGCKIKHQPEIDMLYLQALCGSAIADGYENLKFFWTRVKDSLSYLKPMLTEMEKDPHCPPVEKCYQVLMDLVEMRIKVLTGIDPSALYESIKTKLNDLSGGTIQLNSQIENLNVADKKNANQFMKDYTLEICNYLGRWLKSRLFKACLSIFQCVAEWIWCRKYNFLHNMNVKALPADLQETETRDYEDAGLLLNSPYFSVLRKERDIKLIISLDFSDDDDPFTTVKKAAKTCKELNIPFPEVNIPSEDSELPKDFYVFKGKNTPTVIHIPLFNVINCGDKIEAWRKKYTTFQGPYSAEMITELMELAGKNITKNKDKLLEQIRAAC